MNTATRSILVRRVITALEGGPSAPGAPSTIPVLLGGCGSGRTTLLHQVGTRYGRTKAQYIDVERIATTPERLFGAIVANTPFPVTDQTRSGARASFDAMLEFLTRARTAAGEPATFLLDEFLELRTFESFPGLRRVLHDVIDGLAASGNRFVLSSRYVARTLRLLRDYSARFEVIQMPPLSVEDVQYMIGPPQSTRPEDAHDADFLARTVLALGDGRPSYVAAITEELAASRGPGSGDAISALAALLAARGRLTKECGFCYELRLHRARGYGALKAILEILAEDEGLTLTEISHRLQRTPGSTKDYLSWLEDVDLVTSRQKKYSFTDSLLRVWVRLHCRAQPPSDEELAREVHFYAAPRLPQMAVRPPEPKPADKEPAFAMAGTTSSGIIEID